MYSYTRSLMVGENSSLLFIFFFFKNKKKKKKKKEKEENSKKTTFSWSERMEIFVNKHCKT